MKKNIALLVLVMALPALAFASVFQVGTSVSWEVPIDFQSQEPFSFSNIDFTKYDIGLDARANIGRFQLQGEVRGAFSTDLLLQKYSYNLAASTRFDIFFIDLTAGAGISIGVEKDPVTNDWQYNGQDKTDASTVFSTAELYYRLGLGIDFGKASLEMQATIPTGASWRDLEEERMQSVLATIGPKFERMRVSVGISANFF